jgi:hypothetical protein
MNLGVDNATALLRSILTKLFRRSLWASLRFP